MPIGEKIATIGDGAGSGSENGSGGKTSGNTDGGSGSPEAADVEADTKPDAEAADADPDEKADTESDANGPDEAPAGTADGERIKASPLARRIARDRGVELGDVTGSGPNGRIVKADVEGAEPGSGATGGPQTSEGGERSREPGSVEANKGSVEKVELTRLQQTVSRRMAESKATAPHFYLRAEIDMSRAVEVRKGFKETAAEGEPVPSLNDIVVKAVATALTHHPRANGAYRDGSFELYSRINIGIAVAADDALVVPTIGDADEKDLREIAAESRRLAERVRTGEITPPELSGGTFTISNLGMFGIRSFDAVINSGQAGILAVGEIAERPVVRDGELTAAHLMEVSLACDHRILYGADGAEFLGEVRRYLEEPGLLA